MQDRFHFFQPQSAALASLVSNFFYVHSSDPAFLRQQLVLPYPQLTLGFFLKSPFEVSKHEQDKTLVHHYVFSRISKEKVTIRPLSEEVEIIGANLKPFALRAFSELPAHTLDWHADPRLIFSEQPEALYQQVRKPLPLAEKISLLEDFLLRSLCGIPDPLMVKALEIIHKGDENPGVRKLAAKLDVSERTLRNHFRHEIGISPLEYLQLVRIHAAVDDLKNQQKEQADIYFDNNYFDQAHFIHAFKKIANISPKKFQKKIAAFRYLQF